VSGESPPSTSKMWERCQLLESLLARERQKNARQQVQREKDLSPDRKRLHYTDGERDEEGRHIGFCVACGEKASLKKRRCPACYIRYYRKRRADRQLGGIPVKQAPLAKVS